ncbi:MAG: ABC transporter permease subunit [Thermoleophilia bacterium]
MIGRRASGWAGWAALLGLTALPLLVLGVQAVAVRWFFPDLVPRTLSGEQLRRVFTEPGTLEAMTQGVVIGLVTTAITMVLVVPGARALAFGGVRAPTTIVILVLVPTVIPPIALAMGLSVAAQRAGFVDGPVPVVLAHLAVTIPYAMLILAGFLTRYDTTFEQQAVVLGASGRRVLLTVFLPLAAPGLIVSAAFALVVSWGQYLLTLLPGGGRTITPPVLLISSASGGNPTATAALAIVTAVPPALVVLAVARHLERPLGIGAHR